MNHDWEITALRDLDYFQNLYFLPNLLIYSNLGSDSNF